MLTEEQIRAMVMTKYPKEAKERNCRQHRAIMESKREWYRQQLLAHKECAPTLN